MFNFSFSSFLSHAKEKAHEFQEIIEAKISSKSPEPTAAEKDSAESEPQDPVVISQHSGYSLVAADPQSAANAQDISQAALAVLPQDISAAEVQTETVTEDVACKDDKEVKKGWWATVKDNLGEAGEAIKINAGKAVENITTTVEQAYENYTKSDDTNNSEKEKNLLNTDITANLVEGTGVKTQQTYHDFNNSQNAVLSTAESKAEEVPSLWNKVKTFAGEAATNVKEKVRDANDYLGTKADQLYADASDYTIHGAVNAVLWHESKYDNIAIPENVKQAMSQIDPKDNLTEHCRHLAQTAAPIAAKALLGDTNQTAIDGIRTYFSKISFKIIACLAAEAFNNKKIPVQKSQNSFYEEFEAFGNQEWLAEKAKHKELFNVYSDTDLEQNPLAVSEAALCSNEVEHYDVFDLASETVFKLVEKHLGTVQELLKQIESYAQLPDDSDAAKESKAIERQRLQEVMNPIMEEMLDICDITSIESLGLSDKLVWAIKKYADYKQHGFIDGIKKWTGFLSEDQGISDWNFIKTTLKDQLFDYYCSKLLEEPKVEIIDIDETVVEEPALPDELIDVAQEFLQGTLDRECRKAKVPLSLSADIYKKLRKKVDRKSRLPHFCHRVSTAMADKIIKSKTDTLKPYCNDKTVAKLQEFLGLYFNKIMHKALAHLATSQGGVHAEQDLWLNITATLIDIANKHYATIKNFTSDNDFATSLKQTLANYDALPEDSEEEKQIKNAAYKTICKGCAPIIDDLLQECGLANIEDLQLTGAIGNLLKTAALAGTGETAWDFVRETLQWGLLEIVRMGPELETTIDDKNPGVASVARSTAKDGAPEILKAIAQHAEPIGQSIEKLLEKKGWNIVDARSIERIFFALFEGKDPVFSKFHEQFGDFLSPRVYALLNQAASFNSIKDPNAKEQIQVANILARIVSNASEIMQRNTSGRSEQLQNAVTDYAQQELLLYTLYAAKKHFEKMANRALVEKLIWNNPAEDESAQGSNAELEDQNKNAQYHVALSSEQIDIQCIRILEAAQCTDKITELANAARAFLNELDDSRDDVEVIKTLLFGTDKVCPLDECLKSCTENHNKVEADCNRILAENFTDLATEVMALTGINDDQLTQIPSLAETLDPAQGTVIQWLMMKAFHELSTPQQAIGYNEKLEELLFGPAEDKLDPLSELASSTSENPEMHKAVKERHKTKKAIEFFENTCSALTKAIRGKIDSYLKEDSDEIVTTIDSVLNEKFSPEAASLIREGIQELAETKNPAVKGIFDYTEELLQGALFKLLVKIGKTYVDKSKPINNEQMMSAILLQIFGFMDAHKETIALQMEEWHKLPNATAEDKEIRKNALRDIFKDIAQDLLSIIDENPLKDMVPPAMENCLEKALRKKLLPELLGEMYCETTAFEREKKVNQERLQLLFKNPDNPQKGSTVPQQAMSAIAQYAAQTGRSYLALNSEETATTVVDNFTKRLSSLGSAGKMAADYLTSHANQAKAFLGNNIHALAHNKEQAKGTWSSVEEFVESILLQAFGNMSGEITLLEDGKSELLQNITLHLLQLASTHVTRLDNVRKEHDKDYIYEVSSIDLLKGSAEQAGPNSNNPAFTKQYLEAKEELYNAEKKLQNLKNNRLNFKKQLRDNLGGILGARFRRHINAKIAAIKEDLKPAYADFKAAQKKFDDMRKKACFLPIANDLLSFMNINSADDLPFPDIAKEQLWIMLQQEILPSALQSVFDNLLDKSVLDSMLISALQAINAAMSDPNTGKGLENSRTPEEIAYDTQLGQAVVDMIAKMPSVLIKFFMNIEDINKAAVDLIGHKMRAILSEQSIIKLLHAGLFNGMENLVPNGKWETNADGQQVLMQKDSTSFDFKLPMTPEEQRKADKLRKAEGAANAARVQEMIGRTVKIRATEWVVGKINESWDNFQNAFDRSIAKNCGGIDGWGMQIKRFFDMLFRAIFVQFIGTMLYYLFWPLIKIAELIIDAICEKFGLRFQKSVHAGINDSLGFDVSNEVLNKFKSLKEEREIQSQSDAAEYWANLIHKEKSSVPNIPNSASAA